ncbi:Zn-dependent exopeptidase [Mycena pura]|uniref:Zn-dependent exopeptidase n=1 Tax=Mycena pura TaxID=153505 RepID=A0AAD6YVK6_9AGAR|nr:Zn-dependent exopeptidase [Mycena pura]
MKDRDNKLVDYGLTEPERSQPHRIPRVALVLGLLLCARVFYVHYNTATGFPALSWHEKAQLSMEERQKLFLSVPNADSAMEASRQFTAHPHVAGSPQSFKDAVRMLEVFQEQFQIPAPTELPVFPAGSKQSRWATLGLTSALLGPREPTAWVDIYYPVMDTGREQRLEILGKDDTPMWTADLVEDGDPLDPDAHKYRDAIPTWHGASGDGDVQGQLIYANYGTQADYAELTAAGANLTGKIVMTRYGGVLRGLKIKGTEDLGAVGVLMYSDPRDDGHIIVENGFEPYPAGPARNPTSVQRGSVAYINLYPGDPTTPGYPAYEDSTRAPGSNGPRIPSLPISWANAQRLLGEIDGAPRSLSGAASARSIRLVNHVDAKVTPIWNAMAAIPGHIRDEVVIIGCHRDAWVLGATDPISGTASLHEVVRGYGALLSAGWRPLRTIIFASWDAEEFGLIGSTEYGEDFADWLAAHAVAYINVDGSAQGSQFDANASPSLSHLIAQTARDVPHPTVPGKTLLDARHDNGPISIPENASADPGYLAAYDAELVNRRTAKSIFNPLGSGSDFTVFLQRIGIASSSEAFGGTPQDAVYHYHSIYDSQCWQELYADPGFHRATAVAQHLGLLLLRLTDSIIVPLNTTQYALELHNYLDKVEAIVADTPLESVMAYDFANLRRIICDLTSASIELDAEKDAAEKDFTRLLRQLPKFPRQHKRHMGFGVHFARFVKRVLGVEQCHSGAELHVPAVWEEYLDAQFAALDGNGPHLPRVPPLIKFMKAARRVTKANKKLAAFERGFIDEAGIKGREWYRHKVVAPGRWLGYGATTLPALSEALAIDGDAASAKEEIKNLVFILEKLTKGLRA